MHTASEPLSRAACQHTGQPPSRRCPERCLGMRDETAPGRRERLALLREGLGEPPRRAPSHLGRERRRGCDGLLSGKERSEHSEQHVQRS